MKIFFGRIYYGWVIVLATFLAMLVVSIPAYTFGVFIQPLTETFGWSRANISGAMSVFQLLVGFLAVGFGTLSDKYDIRWVMSGGTVLIGISFFAVSRVSSLTHFYLCFAGLGIGSSALYVPMTSTVAKWFDRRKGLAVGLAVTAFGVGMAFFSPLIELSIGNFGWRNTFVISGGFSLLLLSVAILLMKNPPKEIRRSSKGGGDELLERKQREDLSANGAVRTGTFWLTYFALLFAYISAFFVTTHIVPNAISLGISSFYAATLLTVIGVFNILGRVTGGFLSDKFGVARSLTALFSLQMISLFLFSVSGNLWGIYPVSLLFGLAYGGWAMILPVVANEFFGRAHSGTIMGLFETVTGFGGAIGPYVAGYIFDLTGKYKLAFLFAGSITAIGVILTHFIRDVSEREGLV